jgi:hypothetical protein
MLGWGSLLSPNSSKEERGINAHEWYEDKRVFNELKGLVS